MTLDDPSYKMNFTLYVAAVFVALNKPYLSGGGHYVQLEIVQKIIHAFGQLIAALLILYNSMCFGLSSVFRAGRKGEQSDRG